MTEPRKGPLSNPTRSLKVGENAQTKSNNMCSVMAPYDDSKIDEEPRSYVGVDESGWSFLQRSIEGGNVEVARALVAKGADCSVLTPSGASLLHLACGIKTESRSLLMELLSRGCDPNALDHENDTPIDIAARAKNVQAVRILVAAGAKWDLSKVSSSLLSDDILHMALEMRDPKVLLPSPPDSAISVVWGSSGPSQSVLVPQPDIYRTRFFELGHDVFLGVAKDAKLDTLEYCLCCVKRSPDNGSHDAVFIGSCGFVETHFSEARILEKSLILLLTDEKSAFVWSMAHDSCLVSLKSHILGLEARLGPRRSLTVGVVFASRNQWKEEDMFDTPIEPWHEAFLGSLGERVDLRGRDHFGREFARAAKSSMSYYSSFYGFEVVFHVAPLLTPDERRQYIGNDKVVIYCFEEGDKPFVPHFRGKVNSVGIVCQKKSGTEEGWKVAVFFKEQIIGFHPAFPGHVLSLTDLRKIVLTCAVNGHYAVLCSPPFDAMFAKVFQAQLSELWHLTVVKELQRLSDNVLKDEAAPLVAEEKAPLSRDLSRQRFGSMAKVRLRKENSDGDLSKRRMSLSNVATKPKMTGKLSSSGDDAVEGFPGVALFSEQDSLDDVRRNSGSYSVMKRHSPDLDLDNSRSQSPRVQQVTFGKRLSDYIGHSSHGSVPLFLIECVMYFNRNPKYIQREGIFRVPGSSSGVIRLLNTFATSFVGALSDDQDPDVVASSLKAFFLHLTEPVIPCSHWDDLVAITDSRYFVLDDAAVLVSALPHQNFEVLAYLFEFLATVVKWSSDNKMSAANLGTMFGNVLMRPPNDNAEHIGSSMPKEVCTFFIANWHSVFRKAEPAGYGLTDDDGISSTFEDDLSSTSK